MKIRKKRIFIIVVILIVISFILSGILKKNHDINYQIKSDNITFNINEKYINEKEARYIYKVNMEGYNDINFYFEIIGFYKKKEKIIDDIKYFSDDNIRCIYPVLKADENKAYLSCMENEKLVSFSSIEKISDELLDFIDDLKNDGFNNIVWNNKQEEKQDYEKISYYKDVIEKDESIIIWNYKGIYLLNNEEEKQVDVLKTDKYDNNLNVLAGKYYILPNYDEKYDYEKIYLIDVLNGKIKELKSEIKISTSTYVLGVVDDDVYLFDKDHLSELKIDLKKNNVIEIGNKDSMGKFYNGKWEEKSIYDFNDNIKFEIDLDIKVDKDEEIIYPYNEKVGYYYIIKKEENKTTVFRASIENKKEVKLFSYNDVKDIKFRKNNVYFISKDTLYRYNDLTGIKKIAQYSEFEFNNNLYDVYRE